VEVAALYYISYLFTQKWDHADAIALVSTKEDRLATDDDVANAYEAYEKWFARIKTIGLTEARKQKLDPLAGIDIRWY